MLVKGRFLYGKGKDAYAIVNQELGTSRGDSA
jgi:hypothetical protein